MLEDETIANSVQKNTWQNIKRRNKSKGTKSEPKQQNPMWVNKEQRNKSLSKAPTNYQKAYI
jgi:hypothetical protein